MPLPAGARILRRTRFFVAPLLLVASCQGDTIYDADGDQPSGGGGLNRAPVPQLGIQSAGIMAPVQAEVVVTCTDADGDRLTYFLGFGTGQGFELESTTPIRENRAFEATTEVRAGCRDARGTMSPVLTRTVRVVNAGIERDSVHRLTNVARSQAGISELILDERLTAVAQAHAVDMAQRGYFGHTSPEGVTFSQRLQAAGVPYVRAGENIAGNHSASAAVQSWLDSPGHRANLMNGAFRKLGVGVYRLSNSPYIYYVQVFTD